MDTARARASLHPQDRPTALGWLRRLLVVAGFLLGGLLIGSTSAGADTGRSDLADALRERAAAGKELVALLGSAAERVGPGAPAAPPAPERPTVLGGLIAPQPQEPTAPAAPVAPEPTSSAQGSASSTPGVEVEPTITFGGVDYGPAPWETPVESVEDTAPVVAEPVAAAAPRPPPARAPAPPAPRQVVAPALWTGPVHPAPEATEPDQGDTATAPADRPAEPPAPPAPSAPASGTSAGAAHDGGGQARGALGVLATRDHAATPSGGWPVGYPQVPGAAVEAAGSPTCRPD
ncbi:hypothetical protein [Actinokineospora sp. NPDC004072]